MLLLLVLPLLLLLLLHTSTFAISGGLFLDLFLVLLLLLLLLLLLPLLLLVLLLMYRCCFFSTFASATDVDVAVNSVLLLLLSTLFYRTLSQFALNATAVCQCSLWRVGSGVVWHCRPEGPGLVRLLLVPPQGGRVRQGEHHRQQLQQRQRRPRRREAQQDGDDLVLQLAPDRRQAAVDVDAAVDGDVALRQEVAAAARARLQAARVRHRVLVPADVRVAPDLVGESNDMDIGFAFLS